MASHVFDEPPPSYQSARADDEEYVPEEALSAPKYERFRFGLSEWRDAGFALAFLFQLALVFISVAIAGKRLYAEGAFSQPYEDSTSISFMKLFGFIGVISALSIGSAYIYLSVMQQRLTEVMTLSYWFFQISAACFTVVIMATAKSFKAAILPVLGMIIVIWYYYLIRDRIPLANSMIHATLQAAKELPALIPVVLTVALIQIGWQLVWFFLATAVGVANGYISAGRADTVVANESYGAVTIVMLFLSYYWTSAVISNIAHVTSAGAIASWWLLPPHTRGGVVPNSLRRACTTSLGSICFGSLILALIQTLRALLSLFKRDNEEEQTIAQCIAECLLDCLERITRIVNYYAFTYVAIYGDSFITAAGKVSDLFERHHFNSLINDDISELPLILGRFVVALIAGGAAALWVTVGHGSVVGASGTIPLGAYVLVAAILGFVISGSVFSVVSSGVTTTYVLWAESPEELAAVQRPFYAEIAKQTQVLHYK